MQKPKVLETLVQLLMQLVGILKLLKELHVRIKRKCRQEV